jgi:hypothetical protein
LLAEWKNMAHTIFIFIFIFIFNKLLVTNTYKELSKINKKNMNNAHLKWAKDLSRHFSKENV